MVDIIGLIFTLFAIFTWGFASVVYKFSLKETQPKPNLFFRLCLVSLSTFLLSLTFGNYFFLKNLNKNEMIGYLLSCLISGLCVTIGDLFYYMSLKRIDASRAYPLVQLSLIFVYPFSFFLFDENLTISILLGGLLFLLSVPILSSKDRTEKAENNRNLVEKRSENIIIGVFLAVGVAFLWALAIVSFNQARIISGDVFVTNFLRVIMSTVSISILGIFQREYFSAFRKESRINMKYFLYIGIAGVLSLGFADTLFYKAAEINGLVLTSTLTVNTPLLQQILSILILKEKFRKRFIFAIGLIITGNYIVLFL
ncbi:MAG: EamA family transporter [Promethearchaeota archaeon]|jgi:drug/metabolite transporter (DMT)-like permease